MSMFFVLNRKARFLENGLHFGYHNLVHTFLVVDLVSPKTSSSKASPCSRSKISNSIVESTTSVPCLGTSVPCLGDQQSYYKDGRSQPQ